MASFVELLKEFEDEILGESVSVVRHNAREGFAKWLDQKAAEQNMHPTGGILPPSEHWTTPKGMPTPKVNPVPPTSG